MIGMDLKHAANHAEEELNSARENATILLLLTEDETVQVYHQSPDPAILKNARVSFNYCTCCPCNQLWN